MRMIDPFGDFFGMRDRMISDFGFGMRDPFDNDDFFNNRGISKRDDFGFGNFQNFPEQGGNYVCHSYSSKTTIGPDGKPITEQKIRNKT